MTAQEKRDKYLENKVLPIIEVRIKIGVEGEDFYTQTSFNNIGDMVNWAMKQLQITTATNENLALYGVQRSVEDDF